MNALLIQKIMAYRSTVRSTVMTSLVFALSLIIPTSYANFHVENKSDQVIYIGIGYRGPGRESRIMEPGEKWSVSTVKSIQRVTVTYQDNPTLDVAEWALVGEIKDQWLTPTQYITITSETKASGEPLITVHIKTPLTTKVLKGPTQD